MSMGQWLCVPMVAAGPGPQRDAGQRKD
jgi:hypothetical protein